MRWFRRRDPDPSDPPARGRGGGRTRSVLAEETDWRSYDGVAEAYARVHAPRTALPAADLVRLAEVGPDDRVLDVGAGTGVVARAAEASGARLVVGVDVSHPMLAMGSRQGGLVRYAAAAAIDLPFRDATFDVVASAFTLTHFAKYDTALFDMLRVLRPGGRFGVATWAEGDDEFTRAWDQIAAEFGGVEVLRGVQAKALPWAERFRRPEALRETLYEAGVREARIERREYRFEETAEEYLEARETSATGRFLRHTLGEALWRRFRARTHETFASRFPPAFNDFRQVLLAVGRKP